MPSGTGTTLVTVPTSTPAMRTGESGWRLFALLKVAVISYGSENGFARVKAK